MKLPDGRTFASMVATGTEGCYFDAEGNLLFIRKIRRVQGKRKKREQGSEIKGDRLLYKKFLRVIFNFLYCVGTAAKKIEKYRYGR